MFPFLLLYSHPLLGPKWNCQYWNALPFSRIHLLCFPPDTIQGLPVALKPWVIKAWGMTLKFVSLFCFPVTESPILYLFWVGILLICPSKFSFPLPFQPLLSLRGKSFHPISTHGTLLSFCLIISVSANSCGYWKDKRESCWMGWGGGGGITDGITQ